MALFFCGLSTGWWDYNARTRPRSTVEASRYNCEMTAQLLARYRRNQRAARSLNRSSIVPAAGLRDWLSGWHRHSNVAQGLDFETIYRRSDIERIGIGIRILTRPMLSDVRIWRRPERHRKARSTPINSPASVRGEPHP